jgi:hypothetical protein
LALLLINMLPEQWKPVLLTAVLPETVLKTPL